MKHLLSVTFLQETLLIQEPLLNLSGRRVSVISEFQRVFPIMLTDLMMFAGDFEVFW